MSAPAANLDTLISRLSLPDAGPRRTAILDLIALAASDPSAADALFNHLPLETDERAALLIIRHLLAHADRRALPALWSLYDRPGTPVRIAHAAIVAHDTIIARREARPT